MIRWLCKSLVSIAFTIYFKRRAIKNFGRVRVKGPVILALNHPNAFMDPVAISILVYPFKMYYLARGDAFKPGIATYLLEGFGIIPIFRVQDGGKEGLKKNDETYKRVNHLLKKNKKMMIFAEGLCIQERRLRPLKKGVARMTFGAMEEINNPDLIVIPVGVNYTAPARIKGSVFFNVGEPIRVADYWEEYKEQPAKTMNKFLQDLEPKMRELVMHIDDKKNDSLVPQLETIFIPKWHKEKKQKITAESEYLMGKHITECVNAAEKTDPALTSELREKTSSYFRELQRLGIRDWIVNPDFKYKVNNGMFVLQSLLLILFFPMFVRALLGNYPPLWLTARLTKKIKNIEFFSSFNMGIGAFAFFFWYIIQFFVAYALAPNVWWAFLVLFHTAVTGLLTFYFYQPLRKKTYGIYRALKNKKAVKVMELKRKEIEFLFGKINKY